MTVGIYIDPAQRSLLQDQLFTRNTGRNQSSLIGCLRYMKEVFEPQGVPVHSANLMPPPNGVDRHLYISIGNYKNHERIAVAAGRDHERLPGHRGTGCRTTDL